jgi:hypothetical protein
MYIYYNDGDTSQWVEANRYEGIQGLQGRQGIQGIQSTQGLQGSAGPSGSTVAVDSAIATRFLTFVDVTSGSATIYTSSGITANASSNTINVRGNFIDSKGDVRDIPLNSQTSAYVLVLSDLGKVISITTGGVTVPSAVFSPGDAVSIYNDSASNQTITQGGSVTMYLAGTATTGNRTLAQRGIATVLCVATNTFVISGSGLT